MKNLLHVILEGYFHVLPLGLDHIFFIICVFIVCTKPKEIIIMCSTFTIAHTLTFILGSTKWITIPSTIVEPLIALTIVFSALEHLLQLKIERWRLLLLFFFGLIHGLGFASAISDTALTSSQLIGTIIGFNIGVELGQLTIITLLYLLIIRPFSTKPYFYSKLVFPIATGIGSVALYWFMERIF